MAISLLDSLGIKKKAQNVERDSFPNLEAAVAYNPNWLPSVFHAMLEDTAEIIIYNEANVDLGDGWGKWRPLSQGGSVDLSNYYNRQENDLLLLDKVDKEDGKSLISDAEIERLASVTNYDDSQVQSHIVTAESQIADIQTLIGTDNLNTTSQTLSGAINEVKSGCADTTTLLSERVQKNEQDIATLNADETVSGSLKESAVSVLNEAKIYTDEQIRAMDQDTALFVDEKPIYDSDTGTVTYIKDGITDTTEGAEIWFYYMEDGQLMQTTWIGDQEATVISAGGLRIEEYVHKTLDVVSTYNGAEADTAKVPDLAAMKALQTLLQTNIDDKISGDAILDVLDSSSANSALSANQGRVLNEGLNTKLNKTFTGDDVASKVLQTDTMGNVILTVYDDTISSTSTNAPQTKIVKAELDGKLNIEQGIDNANKLLKVGADGNITLIESNALGNNAENITYTDDNYPTYTNIDIAIKEILARLDWVDVKINSFTLSPSGTQYEYGYTIPSGTLTFNWTLNKNDIASISLTDMSPATTDVSATYEHDLSNTKSFILTVGDGKATHSKTIKISFDSKIYWGSATIPEELTSEWVLGLSNSKFATSKTGTYSFNVNTDEYAVICLPTALGNISEVYIGGFATGVISVGQLNFTNASGGQKPYTVYRLEQHSLGAFSMDIK